MNSLLPCPLAVDDRFCKIEGVGVASYGGALLEAGRRLTDDFSRISDVGDHGTGGWGRLRRWARAFAPVGVGLRLSHEVLGAHDIFRLGQAYFNRHGRPLSLLAPGPPGIAHWGYPLPLRICDWRNIYTVHDTIPLDQPELTGIDRDRHRRLLCAVLSRADAIATVSDTSARDIRRNLSHLSIPIVNCSSSVEVAGAAPAPPAGLRAGRYLAVVGTIERRKNIGAIVAAHRGSGVDVPLVIAGPDGDAVGELPADASDGLIRLPYLSRSEVLGLIAGARALLMPSLAEGFGLPVIEAMKLGTPVLTSYTGALREIAGDAAAFVDPRVPSALARAIRSISEDAGLRERLTEAGFRNAQRFTPDRFRAALLDLYLECLRQPPRSAQI